MDEQNKTNLPELTDDQKNVDSPELTEEQKKQLQDFLNDQATRLGEVFSQCWESEEFKQAFMEDPKAIFEEYGINHKKDSNYKIIDTPDKTIIHVLPYKGVKKGMEKVCEILMNHVKDLQDDEEKQVLLEGWSWQIYQNTEDTFYVPLPICPENLTPEELELVNGGCLALIVLILFEAAAAITSTSVVTEAMIALVIYMGGVVDTVALAVVALAYGIMVVEAAIGFTTLYIDHSVSETTGEWIFTYTEASNGAIFPNAFKSSAPNGSPSGTIGTSVDPRRRGR